MTIHPGLASKHRAAAVAGVVLVALAAAPVFPGARSREARTRSELPDIERATPASLVQGVLRLGGNWTPARIPFGPLDGTSVKDGCIVFSPSLQEAVFWGCDPSTEHEPRSNCEVRFAGPLGVSWHREVGSLFPRPEGMHESDQAGLDVWWHEGRFLMVYALGVAVRSDTPATLGYWVAPDGSLSALTGADLTIWAQHRAYLLDARVLPWACTATYYENAVRSVLATLDADECRSISMKVTGIGLASSCNSR